MKTRTAWAIELVKLPPDSFIGVFWFTPGRLQPWQDGFRTALFSTRKEAREHCRRVAFGRVVKVRVTVERAV